jgi:hypothetical protein
MPSNAFFFFMPSSSASAASSHLRDLLSSLDVDGAASQARRNGGVVVDAVTGEGDSYSGTSHKSTLCDVPVTVVLGLDMELDKKEFLEEANSSPALIIKKRRAVRRGVEIQLPKYAGPAKTFSVIHLSNDLDVFSLIYRATISKRETFCNARNCLVNHQGTVAKVKPGSLIVLKSPGRTAFLHPVIKSDRLDQSLSEDWLSTQETLKAWTTKFDQVLGSSTFSTKVNATALEVTREEERRAADFKMPRAKKRRSSDFDTSKRIGISPYARHLVNGPETFEVMLSQEQIEKLVQMVIHCTMR